MPTLKAVVVSVRCEPRIKPALQTAAQRERSVACAGPLAGVFDEAQLAGRPGPSSL